MKLLIFIFVIFNIACERVVEVPQETYSKMITHRNLGLAYLEEERFNEAANEFKTLTQIANNEPLGHANLGLAYMRMDDELDNAKSALDNALELSPKNPDIKFLLAKIYEIEGLEKKSLSILEKIVTENPEHIKSLYQLGITLSKSSDRSDRELAITYLKRASNILPGNIASSLKLMELLIGADKSDDALYQLQTLQQTLPLIPKDATELLRRILELLHEGNSSEAKVPLIMFHNLLKPGDLYQASIMEVRGTKGPIAGNPITHFMNTQTSTRDQKSKKIRNITFKDVTSSSNLSIANVGFDMENIDDKYYPIFALGDYDLDGDIDLFNINRTSPDNKGGGILLENEGGYFNNRSSYTDFKHDGKDQSVIFSDYDNDGYLDLYICNSVGDKLYRNLGNGKFSIEGDLNLNKSNDSYKSLFLDLDLEGDLDLFIATESKNLFLRNNSDGSFTDISSTSGLAGNAKPSIDVCFSDFDDDGDLDLFVLNEDGSHYFFDNQRQARFKDITKTTGIKTVNDHKNVMPVDYNNDGFIDLFISGNSTYSLYKNLGNSEFILDSDWFDHRKILEDHIGGIATFFDADNDGYIDLCISLTDKKSKESALHLFYNDGSGKYLNPSLMYNEISEEVSQIKSADYDNDGDLDIFLSTTNNRIRLLRNDGGNLNNFIKVKLTGLRVGSGKNNYFGIGSRLELKAGDLYQIKYVDRPLIHFGIGREVAADLIRVVWNNGVPQNRFKPQKNQTIIEEQVLKGSCPYLFGWSGSEFEFITDVLWPSALGMPLGIMAGEPLYAFPNSTDEYLRVPGKKLKMVDGSYIIQFTTELWETPYLDKIHLKAIDHPDQIEVYIDETFTPPPYPSFKIYGFTEKYLPIRAVDSQNNDLIEKINKRDNEYVSNLYNDLYQGVTEFHDIILEFDNINSNDSLFLFLQGWLFPTDASINVNLSHSKDLKSVFPYLQIPNENGEWETVIENLGFPKGKNKTMIANLTNKFINNDYRIRIRTNMQIYWDHIFIANDHSFDEIKTFELEPIYADLHYRGFSATSQKNKSSPHIPDYYSVKKEQKWRDLIGSYTRYGDVLNLLMRSDNKYVIMNSGDEITLKFEASSLPELPDGWSRDFLFYNDGWLKDGDLNTARGQTVEPLPFHGMTSYPEGAYGKYPINNELNAYRKKYNTRKVTPESFKDSFKKLN